jgi:hypothetical protein
MERSSGKLWDELQAQKAEIEELMAEVRSLRSDLDSQRTSSSDRLKSGKKPTPDEGRDGDERVVKSSNGVHRYQKVDGKWYQSEIQDA